MGIVFEFRCSSSTQSCAASSALDRENKKIITEYTLPYGNSGCRFMAVLTSILLQDVCGIVILYL